MNNITAYGKKTGEYKKGLIIDLIAYLLAFGAGAVPFMILDGVLVAAAAFTAAATVVIFAFSVVYSDVSIYDPYWSVAPPVMIAAVMIKYGFRNVNAVVLLTLILIWSVRLTANWLSTYKGLGHEDWRYAEYRKKYPPFTFQIISFFGLHFVPTAVVYAGLVSALLAIQEEKFAPLSAVGIAVMLCAVTLEYVSDRAIHGFLEEHKGEKKTCGVSVWKYSRHPNYLGEMSFWTGMYIYFAALCPQKWYMGLGFLLIIALFLAVSIPMMEKHNLKRRADYADYRAKTSMLLLFPPKKNDPLSSDSE
ncbi:MAG: DUF1295 domain-containing protein [Clostridia bacterium]|nr:DUF1295 domain-containing protein [Clostridia bacterium]